VGLLTRVPVFTWHRGTRDPPHLPLRCCGHETPTWTCICLTGWCATR